MTPRRRARRDPLKGSQIAPLVGQRRSSQPRPIAVTPYRLYVLYQIVYGRVRWVDAQLGYRMDGTACNKTIRELADARWVADDIRDGKRVVSLTDAGRALITNETP